MSFQMSNRHGKISPAIKNHPNYARTSSFDSFFTELYGFVELENEAKKRTTMLLAFFTARKGFHVAYHSLSFIDKTFMTSIWRSTGCRAKLSPSDRSEQILMITRQILVRKQRLVDRLLRNCRSLFSVSFRT
jgi:hypothetical protein